MASGQWSETPDASKDRLPPIETLAALQIVAVLLSLAVLLPLAAFASSLFYRGVPCDTRVESNPLKDMEKPKPLCGKGERRAHQWYLWLPIFSVARGRADRKRQLR